MAYDRYDTRDAPRDDRPRWTGERSDRNERGFFERAGDEVASWFGDEEAERRRRHDEMFRDRDIERDQRRDYSARDASRGWDRGPFSRASYRGYGGEGNEPSLWDRERERGYRPLTGDYGRSEGFYPSTGPRGGPTSENHWESTPYRRSSFPTGSSERYQYDPHYEAWRRRQVDELDRDYAEYRRENQSRFEDEFGSWRQRRQQKRGLLSQIREHMEVVGSDEQHVGTIDRIAGDRIIFAKSDPDSGGVHHSLSCTDIDRVEGDRVILDLDAEQARHRWRDESRSRALFEREDQGEAGPGALNRSFEGTYR
jgi:hypothetical protein